MWDFGKVFRSIGIVVSILLAVAGIFMFVNPFSSVQALAWIFIIGLLVYGIWQLACYIRIRRNGWILAFGLISTGLGLALMLETPLRQIENLVFVLAFFALLEGVSQLCIVSTAKAAGFRVGGLIISGIIQLLVGLFFIVNPFAMLIANEWILAIFLTALGIAMFFSISLGRKHKIL